MINRSRTRRFSINMIQREPDFSEVIEFLRSQKYYLCEIERLEITYRDGTVIVTVRRVNPGRTPAAIIEIFGYVTGDERGYGGYNCWDARGVFRMITDKVILATNLPHHKEV